MVLFDEKEVNAVKQYLKQIEDEVAALADRLKLDGQIRWGLEAKFKGIHDILDKPKPVEQPKIEVNIEPRVAKVDVRTGIKRVI